MSTEAGPSSFEQITDAYHLAQSAIADLKAAVHWVVCAAGDEGCSNAQIGRSLGIYGGHVGHEGHISRTILAMLEVEGVAEQDDNTRRWRLRRHLDLTDPSAHE